MDEEGKLNVNVAEIQEQEHGKESESIGVNKIMRIVSRHLDFWPFSILIFNLANLINIIL